MTRYTIGIGIGADRVSAALVRDGRVLHTTARGRAATDDLTTLIVELGRQMDLGTARNAALVAGFGPSCSQFRVLHGVPEMLSDSLVSQLAAANVERFFVGDPDRHVMTPARRNEGGIWIGVLDRACVAHVVAAAQALGIRRVHCVPTLAVLGAVASDRVVDWMDGPALVSVEYRGTEAMSAQTARLRARDAYQDIGTDSADALAAALAGISSPFSVDPLAAVRTARLQRRLTLTGTVAAVLSILFGVIAPGALAAREARRTEIELAATSRSVAEAQERVSTRLDAELAAAELGDFRLGAHSTVALLNDLAQALPDSTAIVSLRADSAAVSLAVLSRSGARLVEQLSTTSRSLAAPRLDGAITREYVGDRELQRVAVSAGRRRIATEPREPDAP